MRKHLRKVKSLSIFAIICVLIITSTTVSFADTKKDTCSYDIKTMGELKAELAKVPDNETVTQAEKAQLVKKTEPSIINSFMNEKMGILSEKLDEFEMEGEGQAKFDLGDNCTAVIKTTDTAEDGSDNPTISPMASTPGATTIWKDYGPRQFTSRFEFRSGLVDVDLIMINHYTLSAKGVALRYGESDSKKVKGQIDIGSVSEGAVNEVKKTAYKKGESIHINCTFKWKWAPAYDVALLEKRFKMHNYVKYSDIDKEGKQVKVVQSWNGKYI